MTAHFAALDDTTQVSPRPVFDGRHPARPERNPCLAMRVSAAIQSRGSDTIVQITPVRYGALTVYHARAEWTPRTNMALPIRHEVKCDPQLTWDAAYASLLWMIDDA